MRHILKSPLVLRIASGAVGTLFTFSVLVLLDAFLHGGPADRTHGYIFVSVCFLFAVAFFVSVARRGTQGRELYRAIRLAVGIAFILLIIGAFRPHYRSVKISLGEDPLVPDTTIVVYYEFPIWSPSFWKSQKRLETELFPGALRQEREQWFYHFTNDENRGDILGVSEAYIIDIFGMPDSIDADVSSEVWHYTSGAPERQSSVLLRFAGGVLIDIQRTN